MKRRLLFLTCLVMALSCATGAAVALTSEDADSTTQAPHKVESVGSDLSSAFGVFRTAPATASAPDLPAATIEMFEAQQGRDAGANLALARTIEGSDGPIVVVPGDGQVCQIGGGGIGCGDVADMGPTGFSLFSASLKDGPDTRRVSGIVPDGVSSITAVLADGEKVPVPISSNTFNKVVVGSLTELVFSTTEGDVTEAAPGTPASPVG